MAKFCEYCGSALSPDDAVCPGCGAPVFESGGGSGGGIPQTIEELRAFCLARRMPLEQMRFFIGEDYPGARAFGIFQDTDGCFVVYKNKADGSRAVRYRGPDESYAVREIYLKLKDEVAQRRRAQSAGARSSGGSGSGSKLLELFRSPILWAVIVVSAFTLFKRLDRSPERGYYHYNDNYYYYQNDDWYAYDDSLLDWVILDSIDSELQDNYSDYYESGLYDSDYAVSDFSDSSYYEDYDESDYDSDSDWDYDYDSWDAGDTDWDSDW